MAANANWAVPDYRMAKLFESQKNWELYEKYLNDAIRKDPRFTPAYYELSYYKMGRKDLAAAKTYAQKFKENSDPEPQNAYLEASLEWASKNFDRAIAMSKDIISQSGGKEHARVSKLIADAMVQKGDTVNAKPYIDAYFTKADPDEVTAMDKGLQASIYSAIPGQESKVFDLYAEGIKSDTVIDNKIELAKKGALYFRGKGMREKEGDLLAMTIDLRPKPSINDIFDATRAYYFAQTYEKSLGMANKLVEKFPNEVYGYDWVVNNYKVLDSNNAQNKLVPATVTLMEFAQKDTTKYKKQYMAAAGTLLNYYANEAKDRDKALEYIGKMIAMDPTNESLKNIETQLKAPPKQATPPKKTTAPKTGNSSSINNTKKPPSSSGG